MVKKVVYSCKKVKVAEQPAQLVVSDQLDLDPLTKARLKRMDWIVLNLKEHFSGLSDKRLERDITNIKHSLQTYGPACSTLKEGLIENEGRAKGHVFHTHANDKDGTTHVIEWAIVSEKDRIMAIVGFDTHENYGFKKKPLSPEEISVICNDEENLEIIDRIEVVRDAILAKYLTPAVSNRH